MLRSIHIRNYAIVDELSEDFADGFHVFTGETGAGKSILVGALSLVLGARADSGVVRPGCKSAHISATFNHAEQLPGVTELLDEQGIEIDEDELILRRQISSEGRSKAFINGIQVPIAILAELGSQLVDIHGQHAHQSLNRREMQRQLLDQHKQKESLLQSVRSAWQAWRDTRNALANLPGEGEDHTAEAQLLRYQIEELEPLVLEPEALIELQKQHRFLHHQTELQQTAALAREVIAGDDSSRDALARAARSLHQQAQVDPDLGEFAALIDAAVVQLDEAEAGLTDYAERTELDPAELDTLDRKLDQLGELARKHRVDMEHLAEQCQQLQQRLSALEQSSEQREQLQQDLSRHLQDYRAAAVALSAHRQQQAESLSSAVTEAMQTLGMEGGRFSVEVLAQPEAEPSAEGSDRIAFQVSANPGQPLRPLNKVASGGELSRISLAIQVIAASSIGVPSLVFDEVDVGIGGGVAEIVGRLLRQLGSDRQVLCVTHLPQVAALGHHHYSVSKLKQASETRSELARLNVDDRVREIARMLGGVQITEQTLAHAAEMLETASAA